MLDYERDPFLKSRLQVDLAKTEVRLGQCDSARARLSCVLLTLRKRKRDRFSADFLPDAAWALSGIIASSRRLRRKTMPESVQCRVES